MKPDNILLEGLGRVLIADFGLASVNAPKSVRWALPAVQEIDAFYFSNSLAQGTLIYMSPEALRVYSESQTLHRQHPHLGIESIVRQVQGKVLGDGKLDSSDVWGLGAIMSVR